VTTLHPQRVPEAEVERSGAGGEPSKAGTERSGATGGRYGGVLAIAALAFGMRIIHLDVLHDPDDYYMILAARSWLREGTLSIVGGAPYERASLYTYLVAGFMYLFGETSYVARVPAALAGAAWVTLLFVWLRAHVGRTAAWTGALLFCIDPGVILLSRLVRFYTLHGLVFLAVAIGVYHLATRSTFRPRSAWVGLGVAAGFGVAYHLQLTTVVGAMAMAAWLIVELTPRAARLLARQPKRRMGWILGLGTGALLLAVAALVLSGLAGGYLRSFRNVPMWASEYQDQLGFYFRRIQRAYPVLWALYPAAAVVAIARFGRPAVFSVVLFAVPFVVHSLAAFKAERYLSYAMPFFFAAWGMAVAATLPGLLKACEAALARVLTVRTPRPWSRIGVAILILVMIGGIAYTTPAFHSSYRIVRPTPPPPLSGSRPNWGEAAAQLAGPADSADVVVGSFGPSILYHLGRVDVVVAEDHMRTRNREEFSEARQLGRPVISEPESLERLIRCHGSGLVVVDWGFWRWEAGVTEDLVAVITAHAHPISIPAEWNIHAYRWDREPPLEPLEGCPDLRVRER
jgi:hypothetical protein